MITFFSYYDILGYAFIPSSGIKVKALNNKTFLEKWKKTALLRVMNVVKTLI